MPNIISNPWGLYKSLEFLEPEEIWLEQKPQKGDHIRVQRMGGVYSHHGIYISDAEVIHFSGTDDDNILDWSKAEVLSSSLAIFLKDGLAEVKDYNDEEYPDLYPVEHIVAYARTCLGDKGYNLFFNNCEHFANTCTLGRHKSKQIEQLFKINLPIQEAKNMGFFSKVGNFFKNLFGGGSSSNSSRRSTTSYEPDKVKIAEIEAEAKTKLAELENKRVELNKQAQLEILQAESDKEARLTNLENRRAEINRQAQADNFEMEKERIELMRQAKLDILQFETESQIALEQAKALGLNSMVQSILTMQERLNEISEKRLLIIEKGSLQIVREIENFYAELGDKIQADNDRYSTGKLPELLSILEKYEVDSPAHKLYSKRIETDMDLQSKHYEKQIAAVGVRQDQIMASFLQSKERIIEQTGQLTANLLESMAKQQETRLISSADEAIPSLPENKKLALVEENQ